MTLTLSALLLTGAASVATTPPAFRPDFATLQAVPRVELSTAVVEKGLAELPKDRPYRYAVPVDLELQPRQGVWLASGSTASWRLRLQSRGARTLSLQLARPSLPAGAQLWIYDPRGGLVHGPYDAAGVGASGLWTPPVAGDELVIEVRAPAGRVDALRLGTARAFHGFRGWATESSADNCNVDITCPQAAAWGVDAGAVARVSIGGQFLCTGELINNVRQDQRRLFITANHCGIDEDGGPASSVLFYFNYTGPCGNNVVDPLPAPTFQGSVRLAHDVQTDFALVEITDPAPLPPGAYFAGWDATGRPAGDNGAAIHHPSGDEKKIAFHNLAPTKSPADIRTGCIIPAWQVHWSEGTTQAGSSGGGLWNDTHHMIGILSGGFASCLRPLQPDFFARLDRAWTAHPEMDGQLKAHLDPDNTCMAVVPGLDPTVEPQPGPVTPVAEDLVCAGGRSTCTGKRAGASALDALTLALLALLALAAVRRRLQHH